MAVRLILVNPPIAHGPQAFQALFARRLFRSNARQSIINVITGFGIINKCHMKVTEPILELTIGGDRATLLGLYRVVRRPLAERSSFIKPGDEVVSGIRAIDVSGHSPGMLAYHIECESRRLLIWVDTCIHYVIAVQRPDWHLDVDDDNEKAVHTRKRLSIWQRRNGYLLPIIICHSQASALSRDRWTPISG